MGMVHSLCELVNCTINKEKLTVLLRMEPGDPTIPDHLYGSI